jgi:hypothetical protein
MEGSSRRNQRGSQESYTWPLIAIVVVILPQALVPARDRVGPPLLVPLMESLVLLVLLGIAAAARLVTLVLDNGKVEGVVLTADRLLVAAGLILLANVVIFALLYWELDGGGPAGRVAEPAPFPDFQFPQTGTGGVAAPGWRPRFGDHLYLAFTNVVAFSPTDTLPLTLRVKGLMALQSVISLAVIVVVLSRVINILPS